MQLRLEDFQLDFEEAMWITKCLSTLDVKKTGELEDCVADKILMKKLIITLGIDSGELVILILLVVGFL